MYSEDEYLMISGIQHYLFCKRQRALIHIENEWGDNAFTKNGEIIHNKTDNPLIKEKRGRKIISRAMPVSSKKLGISGILDTIEFYKANEGIKIFGKKGYWNPIIVEYKSGKEKKYQYDKAQLMAEALCIEEMFTTEIKKGYIYYNKTDERLEIEFDNNLRKLTIGTIFEMHKAYQEKNIPTASYYRKCNLCSLNDKCLPRLTKKYKSISNYIYGEELW